MPQIRSMPVTQSSLKSSLCLLFATAVCLPAATREITINLYDYAGIEANEMAAIAQSATQGFRQAGIAVRWRNCLGNPSCREDVTTMVVAVLPEHMARKIAKTTKQCGLAATSGPGGFPNHAYVFYDRVVDLAKSEMAPWSLLLGTTIAHEVGHLLLGDNSHFAIGIMRANWRPEEIKQALMGALTFTPQQAQKIRDDVDRRQKLKN